MNNIWCFSIDSINWECVNHRNNTFCGVHPILASYFSHILLRRTSIRSFFICLVAFRRRKASSFVIIVFIRNSIAYLRQSYIFILIFARKSGKMCGFDRDNHVMGGLTLGKTLHGGRGSGWSQKGVTHLALVIRTDGGRKGPETALKDGTVILIIPGLAFLDSV